MNKDSKIYIAGHMGLVGSAIKRTLEAQGHANVIGRTREELDLANQADVEDFFATEKPEYVFLAAAKVGGINANNVYRADFIAENLAIQNNIFAASHKYKVTKLLFLGSVCIYPKEAELPIVEDSLLTGPLEYTNEPYALAKIAGIKMAESYSLQYRTNYVSVMPSNLYGANDNFDLEKSHVIPALIRKMILSAHIEKGEYVQAAKDLGLDDVSEAAVLAEVGKYGITKADEGVVWGSGKPYREFMHADDMGEACVFVMNNVDFKDVAKDKVEVRNTHINLGTGIDISISDLAHLVKELVGFGGNIEFDTSKPDGTYRRYMSVDKIHDLGWRHTIELKDGLRKAIAWYKEQQA